MSDIENLRSIMKFKEMGILPKVTFMGSIAKYSRKDSVFSSMSMLHGTGNTDCFL